jgi:hypothetical protein
VGFGGSYAYAFVRDNLRLFRLVEFVDLRICSVKDGGRNCVGRFGRCRCGRDQMWSGAVGGLGRGSDRGRSRGKVVGSSKRVGSLRSIRDKGRIGIVAGQWMWRCWTCVCADADAVC